MRFEVIESAREALYRFCKGEQKICIPAQDDDDDFLISKALNEYEKLLHIMEHAKRMAILKYDDEKDEKPRFKMDANGNLMKIEY